MQRFVEACLRRKSNLESRHIDSPKLAEEKHMLEVFSRCLATRRIVLPTTLAKLFCPVLELLKPLFAYAWANVDQARLEVLELDRPNLFCRHEQQRLAKTPQRTHGSVFSQRRYVRSRESCVVVSISGAHWPRYPYLLSILPRLRCLADSSCASGGPKVCVIALHGHDLPEVEYTGAVRIFVSLPRQ